MAKGVEEQVVDNPGQTIPKRLLLDQICSLPNQFEKALYAQNESNSDDDGAPTPTCCHVIHLLIDWVLTANYLVAIESCKTPCLNRLPG